MSLILSDVEVQEIKIALRMRAYTSQKSKDFLDTLNENSECTKWIVYSQERYDEINSILARRTS